MIRIVLMVGFLMPFLYRGGEAAQVIDRVVAVVDEKVILLSDLRSQLQLMAMQGVLDLQDEEKVRRAQKSILDQQVEDYLMLNQAERESIEVTSREIDRALDTQIQRVREQFPSEEAFESELQREGLTLTKLKKRYRPQVRDQILKEKLLNERINRIRVSAEEVREFFEAYRDSFPRMSQGVQLRHILLSVEPSQETVDSIGDEALRIEARARAGEDFASLAKECSDDPSAGSDGDLGFFRRGDMLPDFEDAAFSLELGQISSPVRTRLGWHIIKMEERRGDEIRVRHILKVVGPSEQDVENRWEFARELRRRMENGEDFGQLAQQYSVDQESRAEGGDLGWFSLNQLPEQFRSVVRGLEVGKISQPLESQYGIHLLQITDRREDRPITLEDDWDELQELARQNKVRKELTRWLTELRSRAYIDVRMEE